MLRITVQARGLAEAVQFIGKVESMVKSDREDFALEALHKVATVFDRNFVAEGKATGGWPKLADSTVRERESLGIPGRHPILVRYEDLRDYTATMLQGVGRSTVFATTDPQGGSLRVQVETKNGAVNVTAGGTKALHQTGTSDGHVPARPYWYINRTVMNAAKSGAKESIAQHIKDLK